MTVRRIVIILNKTFKNVHDNAAKLHFFCVVARVKNVALNCVLVTGFRLYLKMKRFRKFLI